MPRLHCSHPTDEIHRNQITTNKHTKSEGCWTAHPRQHMAYVAITHRTSQGSSHPKSTTNAQEIHPCPTCLAQSVVQTLCCSACTSSAWLPSCQTGSSLRKPGTGHKQTLLRSRGPPQAHCSCHSAPATRPQWQPFSCPVQQTQPHKQWQLLLAMSSL